MFAVHGDRLAELRHAQRAVDLWSAIEAATGPSR
jgi:hypothetical protein